MRWFALLLPLLLAQGQNPPKPGALEGTVVNGLTRVPVPKATVGISNSQRIAVGVPTSDFTLAATTDESGKFRISGIDPGSYSLEYVDAPGYSPWGRAPTMFSLSDGQQLTGIVLEAFPLGAITGKVTDDDGDPLPGVQIAVMALTYSADSKSVHTIDGAVTDDRGQYRVFNLNPGGYFVNAWLPPTGEPMLPNTRRDTPETGYVPVFYPNGAEVSQATPIQVAGNETPGIDFRLHSLPVYHIRGKLIGLLPSGPAFVNAIPCPQPALPGGGAEYGQKLTPDGRFDIPGIPKGTYCLTLAENGGRRTEYATDEVTVEDKNLDGVLLRGLPAFSVPGVVKVEGQAIDTSDVVVFAIPVSRFGMVPNNALVEDGKLSLEGMVAGAYRISANPQRLPEGTWVKSIRYGEEDAPDGLVNLRPGGSSLTLVLATDAGQLSGSVLNENGDPAGGLMVTIVPPDSLALRTNLLQNVRTDSAGRFHAAGLPPGDYKLYAWGDADVPMSYLADFRTEFAASAVAVTIGPGASATVQLKAIPKEQIRKVKVRY